MRRFRVIIAEHAYRATFPDAPVVPNSTWVPSPRSEVATPPEVVYVGRLSVARGVEEMIALGRALGGEVRVVLIGAADGEVADRMRSAGPAVDWRGPLPNPQALAVARRAAVGLSLLHDIPNYHHSMPTKVIEYLAHGIPVVTTPLPLAADLVRASEGGIVVPFDDHEALVDAVRSLVSDTARRDACGAAGHRYVSVHHNWSIDAERFVGQLESWAVSADGRGGSRTPS